MSVGLVQSEIQSLIKCLERDQIEKDIAQTLKTVFLACDYSDEGLWDLKEFEERLAHQKLYLSEPTKEKLFGCIWSKKDLEKVSFVKIKQIVESLRKHKPKEHDEFHARDLMYGKITKKENILEHPLINLLEI